MPGGGNAPPLHLSGFQISNTPIGELALFSCGLLSLDCSTYFYVCHGILQEASHPVPCELVMRPYWDERTLEIRAGHQTLTASLLRPDGMQDQRSSEGQQLLEPVLHDCGKLCS